MSKRHPQCDTCTCGKIPVEWSDRGPCYIDPDDVDEVVRITLGCVLDHSYDRTHDGVPDGMPDAVAAKLAAAIASHLDARFPKWRDETLDLDEAEVEALSNALRRSLEPLENKGL